MHLTARTCEFGPYRIAAHDTADDPPEFFLAGQRMYAVGRADGSIAPIGAEHLVGEMGGIWAHPLKVGDGLTLTVLDATDAELTPCTATLTEELSHLTWRYRCGALDVTRQDFVAEEQPAYISLVTLSNPGLAPLTMTLRVSFHLQLRGCWFGGLETEGGEYEWDGQVLLGTDRRWRGRWGLACGANRPATRTQLLATARGSRADMEFALTLESGETQDLELLLTASTAGGSAEARVLFENLSGSGAHELQTKRARYSQIGFGGLTIVTPDQALNRDLVLARLNLHMLSVQYPDLGRYMLAGIPEYPQLFGCDTAYSVAGATAAGFGAIIRETLQTLGRYGQAQCGRIPHEVTTNGRVFNPGNTQETPQFARACWDYVRWSGDTAFLGAIYPLCREGVEELTPALWTGLGEPYPIGDGVVERFGMGSRKLDSTCYLYDALLALADMATALRREAEAARYSAQAAALRTRFEQDWWMPAEGLYADSLHTDLRQQLDGHWTVVLPVQLGLAAPERATAVLDRITREWVNDYGLVHTLVREEAVWTLPTGLLALTALEHGRPELGLRLLRNIGGTAEHGTLGALKELIPIGLCFVQLWSSGILLQGVVEGLLGLRPEAHLAQLTIAPCLPDGWQPVEVRQLSVGAHTLDLTISHDHVRAELLSGPRPLTLRYRLPVGAGPLAGDAGAALVTDAAGELVEIALNPGEAVTIAATAAQTQVVRAVPQPEALE